MAHHTVQQIAQRVAGDLVGPADLAIHGIDRFDAAGPDHITFIRDQRRAVGWPACRARAALVTRGLTIAPGPDRALIFVPDADIAVAQVLELFAPPPAHPPAGIHPRATIDPTAVLGKNVTVGPGASIGPGARIGDGCVLHANVTILDHATLGPGCELFPGVFIGDRCELGAACNLHANVVIGCDGFGYRAAPDGRGVIKIPHIGIVRIGNAVEIGAGSCIDRAKFSATQIGDGTKIDNLCQIAHNVRIGRCCFIAGQSAIAGSVTMGDGVQMGGNVIIRDNVTIGDRVRIAGGAAVTEDIPAGESWAGYPAHNSREALREYAAVRRLPDLIKLLRDRKKLE